MEKKTRTAAWLEKNPIISHESCINENINAY